METNLTPYGSSTYSTTPAWGVVADEYYVYGEPIFYARGWCQVGYYSHWFESEQQLNDFIAQRTVLDVLPPFRPDNGTLPWLPGEVIGEGILRVWDEQRYRCKQPHTTQKGHTPDILPALWDAVPSGSGWVENAYYLPLATFMYNNEWYYVIQPHQALYTPDLTPALCLPIPQAILAIQINEFIQPHDEESVYGLFATVQVQGEIYQSIHSQNWWHPSVHGWKHIGPVPANYCEVARQWEPLILNWTPLPQQGEYIKHNNKLWHLDNPTFAWIEPGTQDSATAWTFYQDCTATEPEEPEPDLCATTAEWNGNNATQYQTDFGAGLDVYVKHNNAIWKAKNATHLWIAPDHTGNGAISWEWVKDCN